MKKQTIETTTFTSNYSNFVGKDWQNAYFKLLSWKNTWDLPLILDIKAGCNHEAFLEVVVKRVNANLTREYLEELGYGEINEYESKALEITLDYDSIHDDVIAYFD